MVAAGFSDEIKLLHSTQTSAVLFLRLSFPPCPGGPAQREPPTGGACQLTGWLLAIRVRLEGRAIGFAEKPHLTSRDLDAWSKSPVLRL